MFSAVLEDLFNNLGIHNLESRVLITSVVQLVSPVHHGSPNNSQAITVEDGFEVLSCDKDDGDTSEMATPQVTNSPAATVTPPVVVDSIAVAPNAIGPSAAAVASLTIGLPTLYTPGYVLPSNKPDNAILLPASLITPIFGYHIPAPNTGGPFFCVSRGQDIGIFCGW